jgi:hypothetical protein
MSQHNSIRDAIIDMVKALKPVLKKNTRHAREEAWKKLTDKKGQEQMKKILNDPDRPINTFSTLAFKEWFLEN